MKVNNMKKLYQITEAGKKELQKELEELKSRRGAIADKISDARDFGDLSENAEYDVKSRDFLKPVLRKSKTFF
jgi:transcription elongation factor GreA